MITSVVHVVDDDALVRTAIGGLRLDALDLRQGAWCFLDEQQLASLASAPQQGG